MAAVRQGIALVAAFAFAAVALAACADDESATDPTTTESRPAAIDLKIEIAASAREGAPTRSFSLRCDPDGGDWPSVEPACERLTAELLSPIEIETRDFQQITDQPLSISGRAFGADVSLDIPAQGSGTRLARLRALRTALGPRALDEAERRSR
ncbi:MAG: hypothetical protein ACR2LK_03670 [Solirubrobacteraceae bacterium]